jgi:hypothetical protein
MSDESEDVTFRSGELLDDDCGVVVLGEGDF